MPRDASEYKVQEICHLKGKLRAAEALELLKQVARQVQPIMYKRQWAVRKLSEFIPKSNNLLGLNVNRGAEIKIRLRPPGQEDSFYDWNHVLGTMLHELCHNQIGPHNTAFYKLLDELWSEAEDLMDRGITGTGQGFDGPSAGRLGAHSFIPTHNPPQHLMADAVRKAAEARARKAALMPSGPRKLGGSSVYRNMTPAQAAAAAAERRARDNIWCGAELSLEQVEEEVYSSKPVTDRNWKGQAAGMQQRPTGTDAGRTQSRTAVASAATSSAAAGVSVSAAAASAGNTSRTRVSVATEADGSAAQQQRAQQGLQEWQSHISRQQDRRQQRLHQPFRKRSAAEAIDLTHSDDESDDGVLVVGDAPAAAAAKINSLQQPSCHCCSPQQQQQQHSLQVDAKPTQMHDQHATAVARSTKQFAEDDVWSCSVCTLLNSATAQQCDACLTEKNC